MIHRITDKLAQAFFIAAYRVCFCLWFIFRPKTFGVNVAIWYNSKILLIKTSYKNEYTVPGGYIKRGENKTSAAVRELEEEITLQVKPEELKYFTQYTSDIEYKKDTTYFFEIELNQPPVVKVDNREVVWADFISPTMALGLNISPYVRSYIASRG